jgi:AraC-like DNA-binding protein
MRSSTPLTKSPALRVFPNETVDHYMANPFVAVARARGEDHTDTGESLEEIVRRSILHMSADLAERHTLEAVAEAAGCGPFSLIRAFRRLTGTTPIRFLTILRLAEAKRLLLVGDARVIDACYEVGYESLGSFNNRFKALVGLTPTELRRKLHTLEIGQRWAQRTGALHDGFIYAVAIYRAGAAHSDLIDLVAIQGSRPQLQFVERGDYEAIYYASPIGQSPLDLLLQRQMLRSDIVPLAGDWQSTARAASASLRPSTQFDPPALPVIVDCLDRHSPPVALRALA